MMKYIAIALLALALFVLLRPATPAAHETLVARATSTEVTPAPPFVYPTLTPLPDGYPAPATATPYAPPYPAPMGATQVRWRVWLPITCSEH